MCGRDSCHFGAKRCCRSMFFNGNLSVVFEGGEVIMAGRCKRVRGCGSGRSGSLHSCGAMCSTAAEATGGSPRTPQRNTPRRCAAITEHAVAAQTKNIVVGNAAEKLTVPVRMVRP